MALWKSALNKISAKVAAYQVTGADFGTTFTTRGATAAVTFTLPPLAEIGAGWWCEFYNISATGFVIASHGSSDNIVALNDAGADSITVSTTSLIIGAYVRVIYDGTSWLSIRGAGNTYAVA